VELGNWGWVGCLVVVRGGTAVLLCTELARSSHPLGAPRGLGVQAGFVLSGIKQRKEPAKPATEPQNPRLFAVESSSPAPSSPGLRYNLLGPPL
jgi:hypothetical protein